MAARPDPDAPAPDSRAGEEWLVASTAEVRRARLLELRSLPQASLDALAREQELSLGFATSTEAGQRIVFARGARLRLAELLPELGEPAGVVASASQLANGRLEEIFPQAPPLCFDEVRAHATSELCERAAAALDGAGCVVALGGGSAIGIAKAAACHLRLPLVALPSTYSGSELTMLYGLTEAGHKRVLRDPLALPRIVLYDGELLDGMPLLAAGASLVNCLAHLLECPAGYPADALARRAAEAGCRAIAVGIQMTNRSRTTVGDRAAVGPGGDRAAAATRLRGCDELLLAGMWGGLALANGSTGPHHALCHAIGGRTGASHGEINAVVLPAVLAQADREWEQLLVELLAPLEQLKLFAGLDGERREQAPATCVAALRDSWGLPTRLREVGVTPADALTLAAEASEAGSERRWGDAWPPSRFEALIEGLL